MGLPFSLWQARRIAAAGSRTVRCCAGKPARQVERRVAVAAGLRHDDAFVTWPIAGMSPAGPVSRAGLESCSASLEGPPRGR